MPAARVSRSPSVCWCVLWDLNQPWAKQEGSVGTFYSRLSSGLLPACSHSLFQCVTSSQLYWAFPLISPPPCLPAAPYSSHHLELGIHWTHPSTILIRGKKYYKDRTQAGSLAKARYYFGWTVPLSVDWGRLTAWGEGGGWQREEEWCTVRTSHYYARSHSLVSLLHLWSFRGSSVPLFSVELMAVTLWNMCKGRARGVLLCNSAFPNRSSTLKDVVWQRCDWIWASKSY